MRERYWDACKGLAILSVLLIHCTIFDQVEPGSGGAYFLLVVRQFVNFGVAVFLGVSGLFAGLSPQPKGARYIGRRLARLLPPYILWSSISISLYVPFHWASVPLLFVDFVAGQGLRGIGYFVTLLAQMIVLTPLIDRIRRLWVHVALMVVLTALGLAFTYVVGLHHFYLLSKPPYSLLPFPVFYPLYHLGFMLGKRARSRGWSDLPTIRIATIFVVVGIAVELAEAFLLYPFAPGLAISQTKASSIACSAAIFVAMVAAFPRLGHRRWPGLAWLGRNSYPIYLTHLFFVLFLYDLLRGQPMTPPGSPIHVVLLAVGSLAACVGAIAILRRILPRRWQPFLLG